ncbi:cation:proton antiporter [Variovorax sp. WS11]|uniref:cation:proton antiporter n=1 Tax=Variovorax sp. WS11 TaxID=1105204 RepID=UPI001EF365AF|nr:cation:proton antiporter [Variovorax sp. WS11]
MILLQFARHLGAPYPTLLALAGTLVAMLPGAPGVEIEPGLALALFIAPALMDAAYDLPPRELRRNWLPVFSLAALAVIFTTAAVAALAVGLTGMPLYAGIALGAIVAPPDAAAATAVLSRFALPRQTLSVLKGESLLNDAVALIIFGAALQFHSGRSDLAVILPDLGLAIPLGLLIGCAFARLYLAFAPRVAGTLGATLFEIVTTFGAWVMAERLHASAVLSMVAFAMIVARQAPDRQAPRDRVHSHAVWGAIVFMLNVFAFLLVGLQARTVLRQFEGDQIGSALLFAAAVVLVVVGVRLLWVLGYNRAIGRLKRRCAPARAPTLAQGLVVSWSGMRGLVTLAAALALPTSFPARDLILLSAFAVVLGTLVIQGLTLGPLIRRLQIGPDGSYDEEMRLARSQLIEAAEIHLQCSGGGAAARLRAELDELRVAAEARSHGKGGGGDALRLECVARQRAVLSAMRMAGEIGDDVFQVLQQELDWTQLAHSRHERLEEG